MLQRNGRLPRLPLSPILPAALQPLSARPLSTHRQPSKPTCARSHCSHSQRSRLTKGWEWSMLGAAPKQSPVLPLPQPPYSCWSPGGQEGGGRRRTEEGVRQGGQAREGEGEQGRHGAETLRETGETGGRAGRPAAGAKPRGTTCYSMLPRLHPEVPCPPSSPTMARWSQASLPPKRFQRPEPSCRRAANSGPSMGAE